jgi:hypothetical protein
MSVTGVIEQDCPGIDPGLVPAMSVPGAPFLGELKCIQIDGFGSPVGGNALKGEAILEGANSTISTYNAVGVAGINVDPDGVLNLDNVEYNACPNRLEFTTLATGIDDPGLAALPSLCTGGTEDGNTCVDDPADPCLVGGGTCDPAVPDGTFSTETEITLVPCSQNFEQTDPDQREISTVQVRVVDEMEVAFSTAIFVDCWYNTTTTDITLATLYQNRQGSVLKTILFNSVGPGVLGVAETFRFDVANVIRTGSDAINAYVQGFQEPADDAIIMTAAGFCNGGANDGLTCIADTDCPGGTCD